MSTSTPEKHRVLVVDDEESVREVFALLLQREGYEVATAENGFDGLLKLKQLVPDAFLRSQICPLLQLATFCGVTVSVACVRTRLSQSVLREQEPGLGRSALARNYRGGLSFCRRENGKRKINNVFNRVRAK